jgi:hypothetical protein
MRKIRNPRYAPEFLERKLSPSSSLAATVPAIVMSYDGPPSPSPDPTDPTSPTDPTDPTPPPGSPGGPSGPC